MTDLQRMLAAHPFAASLTDDDVARLAELACVETFVPNQVIYREDEPAREFLLLQSGRVAVEMHAPPGVVLLESLDAGATVGWSTFFPPYTWGCDIRAIEATEALAIDGVRLRPLLEQAPDFGLRVMRALLATVHQRLERSRLHRMDLYQR